MTTDEGYELSEYRNGERIRELLRLDAELCKRHNMDELEAIASEEIQHG